MSEITLYEILYTPSALTDARLLMALNSLFFSSLPLCLSLFPELITSRALRNACTLPFTLRQTPKKGTSKIMWTSITKCPFVMNTNNPSPKTNWLTSKLNTWKKFIKRNVDANICRNFRTWVIVGTLTTSHPRKSHQSHWTATMTLVSTCHLRNHQSIYRESSEKPFSAFRGNLQGESW